MCAAGAVQVVWGLSGLRFPLPATSGLNRELVSRWTAPDLAVEIQQRSGPIVITIEYVIDEADIDAFLAAVTDRRRIPRRHGARQARKSAVWGKGVSAHVDLGSRQSVTKKSKENEQVRIQIQNMKININNNNK